MLPVLTVLADQGSMKTSECAERVATKLGLSEEDRLVMLPSGSQRLIVNRTGWAAWYMMQAGLVSRPSRGVIQATEEGKLLLAKKPPVINNKLLQTYPLFIAKMKKQTPEPGVTHSEEYTEQDQPPDEQIESAFSQLNESLASELQDHLLKKDPFDKAFDHGIRYSLVLEEQMDIKEIPGMLAIKGGNEFATVELRMGQRGYPKFCEEEI